MISTISESKRINAMRTHIFIAVFLVYTAVLTFFVNIEPRSSAFHETIGMMGIFLPIFTTWLTVSPPYTPTWFMLPRLFGRFLSACMALLFALAVSLVFPMALAFFGDIDITHILGAYLGLFLLGIAYLLLGVCIRRLFGSGTMLGVVSFVLSLCLFFTVFEYRFSNFIKGLLNLSDVVFFVSFSAFFVAFAMLSAKKIKRKIMVSRALVIVIGLVLVNMLSVKFGLTADLTVGRIFSLSAATQSILDELAEPVYIYAAFPSSRGDTHIEAAREILRQYSRHRNVNLRFISPMILNYEGFENITPYSIAVTQHGNTKVIPPEKLFLTTFDEYELQINITALNIEAELTNAILYCTADEILVVGQVLEHSEHSLPPAFLDALVSANFDVMDVLITEEDIPPEVSVLLVTTPATDLTMVEAARLTNFLDQGGSAVFAIDADTTAPPHFIAVLANLGVELGGRFIIETQDYLYAGNNILTATLPFNIDGQTRRILMPSTQAVYLSDSYSSGVNVSGIVTTSPYAFEQLNHWDDTDDYYLGVFTLAAKVEAEKAGSTTRAIVLGSSLIFDETANSFSDGENYRFLVDSINWTQHIEHTLDIIPTPLNKAALSINNIQAITLIMLLGVIFPAIILIIGLRQNR